jgi:glucan 1,4-alpha-maltotetraohydrolase
MSKLRFTSSRLALATALAAAIAAPGVALAEGTAKYNVGTNKDVRYHGGDEIVLQGFHWNSIRYVKRNDGSSTSWYNTMNTMAQTIADTGITTIWMPPPWRDWSYWGDQASLDGGGGGNEGYFWHDYDRNSAWGNGEGGTAGTGGTQNQLLNFVNNITGKTPAYSASGDKVKVIYDIVPNHRQNRGDSQDRYTSSSQWRTSSGGNDDGDYFTGGDSDLNTGDGHWTNDGNLSSVYGHVTREMRELAGVTGSANLKADGFRFDFVRGYSATRVDAWMGNSKDGGFCIGELWKDPISVTQLAGWAYDAECTVFDFALKKAFQGGYIGGWGAGLNTDASESNRIRATTFVDNHDTGYSPGGGQHHWPLDANFLRSKGINSGNVPDWYRDAAYVFTLTTPGTPSVYWPDLFDWGADRANHIKNLIKIRKQNGILANAGFSWGTCNAANSSYGCVHYTTTNKDDNNKQLKVWVGDNGGNPGAGWSMVASGNWGSVWQKNQTQTQGWTSLNFRGTTTTSGWGCVAMTKGDGNVWKADVQIGGTDTPYRFKLEKNTCAWTGTNVYGDNTTENLVLDNNCSNCDIDASLSGAGTYRVEVNESTLAYTVTKLNTDSTSTTTNSNTGTNQSSAGNETQATTAGQERTIVFLKPKSTVSAEPCTSGYNQYWMLGGGYNDAKIGINHTSTKHTATASWKQGDTQLDWSSTGQAGQGGTKPHGSPLEYVSNSSSYNCAGTTHERANSGTSKYPDDGFGYYSVMSYGNPHVMLDVTMDCTAAKLVTTGSGSTLKNWYMFEFKGGYSLPGNSSFTWEGNRDINVVKYKPGQSGATDITVYNTSSGNHFALCGKMNYAEFDSNTAGSNSNATEAWDIDPAAATY